jgi:hypothetical protein
MNLHSLSEDWLYFIAPRMWLGANRGFFSDWVTQQWVKVTGRKIDPEGNPWLAGPIGKPTGIGANFFDELAKEENLSIEPGTGLIGDFTELACERCRVQDVDSSVVDFYEHTADYELEAWSEWSGAFRPFGQALARIFSRRLQQLNVPLSGLETSGGITSQVINLRDRESRELRYTAWVRQLLTTRNVLYSGSYSLCVVPGFTGRCVKVVFPLPNGNAMVIMHPESHPDGSFSLTSSGHGFGDPGFYFTVHDGKTIWARYVRGMKESIRLYPSRGGEVLADHNLKLWGATFLRLHYRLRRTSVENRKTISMMSA